jgi:hypothetical protein
MTRQNADARKNGSVIAPSTRFEEKGTVSEKQRSEKSAFRQEAFL